VVGLQLCLSTFTRSKRGTTVRKSTYTDMILLSQKRDFKHFSRAKVCYSHGNVRFENFMHMEWSEEKFLKGIWGDKGVCFKSVASLCLFQKRSLLLSPKVFVSKAWSPFVTHDTF